MTTSIDQDGKAAALNELLGVRSIVLVGMMGAGKSSVGKRLARRLNLAFADADTEIEQAAGMTIPEIFAHHGEPAFRDGEKKVIARLLEHGPMVLATGGGAYMNGDTRDAIARHGITVWLKAELDVLLRRVRRRDDRPLLKTENPEATLARLIEQRYPVYAQADVTVVSHDVPQEVMVDEVIDALTRHLGVGAESARSGDET
ncbi:Shikimate kinase [Ancylobacter novellus DSM 506]|uniref:Shikimate kinase n=1 Tax=Ancylobacter novellus (strain ATCC 8093 / DSM 506 / JCM 20403 / CCM 1077 / IAM 12100 / NBRC 12443 / NCIMB 10456) TaxID=639283 RepID=D7A5W9_ANCN5|nr:shikimate kinase [Ancylobacter novellus]ADH90084.1 Shikimate kinase [Ancylobacter novellus DSM 506]